MTPDVAMQKAVGDLLATVPAIVAHVPPSRIRDGIVRPESLPAIILGQPNVTILGRASARNIVAELRMMVHVWCIEDGTDAAQEIAGAAVLALLDAPRIEGFAVTGWERPTLAWVRDPDPEQARSHGVIALRCTLQWRP